MESLCARHITLLNGQKHKILKKKKIKNYFARIFMIKCQLENIIIEGKQEVSMDTNDRTGFNH